LLTITRDHCNILGGQRERRDSEQGKFLIGREIKTINSVLSLFRKGEKNSIS